MTELAAAIARLYERHAELSPEGPERERAAVTARWSPRCTATTSSPRRALERGLTCVHDHRRLGLGSGRGRAGLERSVARIPRDDRRQLASRVEEILALGTDALPAALGRSRHAIARAADASRRRVSSCACFGEDGRQVASEIFDPDEAREALARFEQLTAPAAAARRVAPNAATACAAALVAAVAARDLDAVAARARRALGDDPSSERRVLGHARARSRRGAC